MGISFANIGDYDRSARFYVRALQLNPNAPHVWGYLRTSIACGNMQEHLPLTETQDLDALSSLFPLE
jgi:peroxin-5